MASLKSLRLVLLGPLAVLLLPSMIAHAQSGDTSIDYILDRYFDHMGGRGALERIKSVRMEGLIRYPNGQQHALTVLKKKPDRIRIVIDTGFVRYTQGYDGQVAWMERQFGQRVYHERMTGKAAEDFIREAPLESILFKAGEKGATVTLGPDIMVAQAPCYQIIATLPDGSSIVHYVEKSNFLERRILQYDPAGTLLSEIIPGRFETIAGVVFATQIVRLDGGQTISTLNLEEIEVNVGILDKAFSPPVPLTAPGE